MNCRLPSVVALVLPILSAFALPLLQGCSCGAGDGDTRQAAPIPVPSTPKTLEIAIGGGDSSFAELADGDAVGLVHGAQGGYHVWTSVRVSPAVDDLTVNLVVTAEGRNEPLGQPSGWAASRMTEHGYIEVDGLKAYVDSPDEVVGKTITIHAAVVARDGRHGESTRTVRVAAKPVTP